MALTPSRSGESSRCAYRSVVCAGRPPQNERDTGQRFRNRNAAWAAARALQRQNPDKSYILGFDD